jgi:hypothetical protein
VVAPAGHLDHAGQVADLDRGVRLVVVPSPSSPKLLLPHVLGVPGPAAPAGTAASVDSSAATRAARRKDRVRMLRSSAMRPGATIS